MNIKLDFENDRFAVISKGSYGFNLEFHTPTTNEKAKSAHSVSNMFYPNLKGVANKLIWLGMDGDSLSALQKSIEDAHFSLSKQLTQTWESIGETV